MEYRVRLSAGGAAGVISLALVVSIVTSTVVAARAYQARGAEDRRSDDTITVKGSTRQRITSDRAVWRIGVRSDHAELREAFSGLEATVAGVRDFLSQRGFADAEIGLAAIQTTTHYTRDEKGIETRQVAGYSLSRTLVVATESVLRVNQAAGEVTKLIEQGMLVISQPPEYYYTRLSELKVELLGVAAQDARTRAETIASNTGAALGGVRSVHMGVLQITQPDSTEVADYGIYDTSTIEKDVTAVVTVTFGVR